MKFYRILFPLFFITACDLVDTENKNSDHQSGNGVTIKYPLPKSPDSLFLLLKIVSKDTNKVNVLNKLGWALMNADADTAIILGQEALAIAEELKTKAVNDSKEEWVIQKGIANTLGNLGVYYWLKADYSKALDFHFRALSEDEGIKNKKGLSRDYNNIGLVYWNQGDYPKAIDNYLKALPLYEELGNQEGLAAVLTNIGNLYFNQADYVKAREFHERALKIGEEMKDQYRVATQYGNVGLVYHEQGYRTRLTGDTALSMEYYSKALEYYMKSVKIENEISDLTGLATRFGNISSLYADLSYLHKINSKERNSLTDSVMKYAFKAIAIDEELGNLHLKATNLGNLGSLFMENKNYEDAFNYLYSALAIDDSLGATDYVKTWYEALSKLYQVADISLYDTVGGSKLSAEQMRLRSLYYYKRHMAIRDTLFSEENKKQLVQKEMNYEFDKKEATTKAENDKKEALAKEELKQKEMQRNYFIGGFGLVLILAGFIFRSYRQKQKANAIISHQKMIVEEKQKEILDSIHYAKRIQKSLLPTEMYIHRNINRQKSKN